MKVAKSLLVLALSLALLGCKTVPAPTYSYGGAGGDALAGAALSVLALTIYPFLPKFHDPDVIHNGDVAELRSAATTDARADIARGRPGACYAYDRKAAPIGVPEKQQHIVAKLRRIRMPPTSACEGPSEARVFFYGEAYNKTIIGHLTGASYE